MLTTEDFKVMLSIIEAASKNGLFRPSDFVIIGDLYSKIQLQIKNDTINNKE